MISERQAAERIDKIKISAYVLFQEKGVDGVTYRNIAAHSGISESSIYHYFPKKSTLVLDLHLYLWREIADELKARTINLPAFQAACGYQQIDWLIDAFEQVHLEHPEYLRFALESKVYWTRKNCVISKLKHESIMEPVMSQFTAALHKGVEDKSINLCVDFESACFLLWGILRAYLEQMVALDKLFSEKSNFSQYFKTFKHALLKSIRV